MPEPGSATNPKPRKSRIGATLRALIRTRVTAGLLVALPIYVCVFLVKFVFGLMRDSSQWVVEAYVGSELGLPFSERVLKLDLDKLIEEATQALGHAPTTAELYEYFPTSVRWGISIFSVFLTIIILYLIGLFAANLVGRRVITTFENVLDQVPLVKTVYRSTKQILATFAGEQSQEFQRVALVPFPQEKMRAVGFITATFTDSVTGDELAAVFIPTTPNPTTGYLQVLKRSELVELDWSVEDAVRTIMSGGILRPDYLTIVPTKELKNLPKAPDGKVLPPARPPDETA